MNYETLLYEKADGIATITFNRPEKLNAYTDQMGEEFMDAIKASDEDEEVRVVVLTGAGRAFCAGADVGGFSQAIEEGKVQRAGDNPVSSGAWDSPLIMRSLRKPIIAAINGPAVGVGFTISIACDIRIASEEARLGAVFARVGLIPEFGSTYTLPRLIGIAKACELCFTAKIIGAQEAKEIGLVNEVVPASELMQVTHEMAATIASMPPISIRLMKRGLYQGLDADLATQLQFEATGLYIAFRTEDHAEGVKAFLEKRRPEFRGR